MKNKLAPRVLTDSLIGYCRTGKKWDTELDSLEVQKARMEKWAKEKSYTIDSWVIDDGNSGDLLYMAYDRAFDENTQVLVASGCRVADGAEEFLNMFQNEATPLLTADTPGRSKGEAFERMGFIETLILSQRVYRVGLCEEFLTPQS